MRQLFIALSISLFTLSALAQKPASTSDFTPSSAIKWAPANLLAGSVNLQGEYNFKNKKSLTVAIGIPMETTNKMLTVDDQKQDIKIKTLSALVGYRMYMGKKSMSGFYFEPYLHYTKNEASTVLKRTLDNKPVDFLTTSDYKAFGVGAQLGVQFMIAKRVVIDFYFLGLEGNSTNFKVVSKETTTTLPWSDVDRAEAEREIKEAVNDIPIIGKKINVTVDPNQKTVTTDYSGFLPAVRLGLSVGIRF